MQNEWIVPKKARLNAVCTSCRKFSSSSACRVRCCISSAARLVKVTTTRCGSVSASSGECAIDKTRYVIELHFREIGKDVGMRCKIDNGQLRPHVFNRERNNAHAYFGGAALAHG